MQSRRAAPEEAYIQSTADKTGSDGVQVCHTAVNYFGRKLRRPETLGRPWLTAA